MTSATRTCRRTGRFEGDLLAVLVEAARTEAQRSRLEQELGDWPAWMDTEARLAPDSLAAFLDLAPDDESDGGLDAKSRELVYVGAASCPAIADQDLTRAHMRLSTATEK